MMVVRFKTGMSPYQSGEVAGFPEEEARRLIRAGVVEEYGSKAMEIPPANKMVDAAPNKSPARTRRK